jgi:hypothetical protein
MSASKVNLKIEQGATLDKLITWKSGEPPEPVDLTGCAARAQFREKIESTQVLLELSTENGMLELGGTAGTVRYRVNAVTTAAMQWRSAVHDLEIIFPDETVRRLIYGSVSVSPEVTREQPL